MSSIRPTVEILSKKDISIIIDKAITLLSQMGIYVGSDSVIRILQEHDGIKVPKANIVMMTGETVEKCLKSVPSSLTIDPQDNLETIRIEGDNFYYVADSVGKSILDWKTRKVRKPTSKDLVEHIKVLNECSNISIQSVALLCSDVPMEITNTYRWYVSLLYSPKPMFGGFWDKEDFFIIKDMLTVLAGSDRELRERPMAVHGLNPFSPLGLTDIVAEHLVNAANAMLPVMLVPIPLAGGSSPVTLAGTLVQNTAENLGALVVSQLANPGAPLLFGGGPSIMDMRKGTAAQASIEAVLLSCGIGAIGKHLGLPTGTNVGRADSKLEDYQAGQESTSGLTLAALAGINMIRGSGALEYCNLISLEKLLLDNEVCGMATRLARGIMISDDTLALSSIKENARSDTGYMDTEHTLRWFRSELHMPSNLIDRTTRCEFEENQEKNAQERASDRIEMILANYQVRELDEDKKKELDKLMLNHAKKYGMNTLPVVSDIN